MYACTFIADFWAITIAERSKFSRRRFFSSLTWFFSSLTWNYVYNADFENSYQITIAEKARAALQQQVQCLETKLTELARTESTPTTPTQSARKLLAAPAALAHPSDPALAKCGCVSVAETVEMDRILGEVAYLAKQGFYTLTDTQHEMKELNR